MSLENIAAGLFNFNPVAGLQAGTSMGAQMMQIALQSQQQQLDAGAKWDQAALAADRNSLARRTQMFNEMTANLNRFDEQARQKKVEAWASGGGGSSWAGSSSGGGGSVNYADLPSKPAPAMDAPVAKDNNQYLTEPAVGFNAAAPNVGADSFNAAPGTPNQSLQANPTTIVGSTNARMAARDEFGSRGRDLERPGDQRRMDRMARPTNNLTGPAPSPSPNAVSFSQAAPEMQSTTPSSPVKMGMPRQQAAQQASGGQQMPFAVDWRTRDAIRRNSAPGQRLISLDYNSSSSGGNYAMIVIPDNATEQERAAAQNYVQRTTEWFRSNGIDVADPVVKTTRENGRGVGGFFHTEPAFVENKAAMSLLQEKGSEYADILASTLGGISGATFIAPHKTNDPGASGNGFLGERDFARQFILPHLSSRSGAGIRGEISAYSPQRGASNVSGAGGEGGYAAAKPGPDGVAEVRTLEDFAAGRSPYVTVAGNESLMGRKYTIPKLPFMDASGNTRTLENVPVVVHDTGSAFKNAPEGRFDIPIGRDQNDRLMARNHEMWNRQGVSFVPMPMTGEAPSPQPIGTAPTTPAQPENLPYRPSQAQQFYGPQPGQEAPAITMGGQQSAPAQSPAIDFNQFPEYRAAQEARAAFQQNLAEKTQNAAKLATLRGQLMEIDQQMLAKDSEASAFGVRQADPLYRIGMNPLRQQRAKIEGEIAMLQEANKQVLERESVLEKSAKDADAAWKIVQDNQLAYQRTMPDAGPPIDRESMVDAYLDADPRERIKMRTRFADDRGLMGSFAMADDFLANQASGGAPAQKFKIGASEYTMDEIVKFYGQGGIGEDNPVRDFVDKDPKLKEQVKAAMPSQPASPAPEPGVDPIDAKLNLIPTGRF